MTLLNTTSRKRLKGTSSHFRLNLLRRTARGKLIPFRKAMKNPETKTKLRAVLKAAIWGGLIFAALTAFAMFGCVIFRGNSFGGLYFWASVPGDLLWHAF